MLHFEDPNLDLSIRSLKTRSSTLANTTNLHVTLLCVTVGPVTHANCVVNLAFESRAKAYPGRLRMGARVIIFRSFCVVSASANG
jgi:hypothetical protein